MKRVLLCLVALLLLAAEVWARDFQTLDGKVYKNVVVTRVEATGIRVSHDDGIGFIDFMLLPSALRKEFGFSQEAYAAGVAAKDQADAAVVEAKRQADLVAIAKQQEAAQQQAQALARVQANVVATQPETGGYARISYSSRNYAARNYSAPTYSTGSSAGVVSETEKTEHVSGYYRKDGTYVHSYNRRPRSH